jgi:arsenite methyltransferase
MSDFSEKSDIFYKLIHQRRLMCKGDIQMTTNSVIPIQDIDIHAEVRDHYAERAVSMLEGTKQDCCGDSCSCGYSAAELDTLPQDVVQASWGCGDPVTLAALQPGQRVLDLGSGGGLDCLLAAQKVGATGWVIGVDMTPEMLSLAWRNAAKVGLRNVEFRYGHIEQLPVENDSIDVILSNCVINLSPDKPAVFREAHRVLTTGGKFAVSDIVSDGDIPASAQADLLSLAGCVSGAMKESDYLAAIKAAGFSDVRVVDRGFYANVPNTDVKTYSVRVEAYKTA